uniref:C2H2-type domain-containing protein n=1 Tax=Panagrolaimus sp. ES5 TaxID=591445 RepID=A0AC34G8W0_9BILA
MSKESGVEITKYSFSEPQNGKGNCDRIAALVKNKIRRFIRAGNNVNNEKEFYNAAVSYPGISYVTIIRATVKRVDPKIPAAALKGIASYYIFTPLNEGILVHRAANIGEGKLFKYNKFNFKQQKIPILDITDEQTFEKIDNEEMWRSDKTRNKADYSGEKCHIFECPNVDCDETFVTYSDYIKHVVFSQHGKVNQMRDYAAVIYQEAVKQQKPSYNNLAQILNSERTVENALDEDTAPKLGWGHRKPKKLPEITGRAEQYVSRLFNDGVRSKAKKWKPKDVATAMTLAKDGAGKRLFRPYELLFAEQIQQMFSKFAAEQKKTTRGQSLNKKPKTTCEEKKNELESEGEDVIDCVDKETEQNREVNRVTRGRRLLIEQETEESHDIIAKKTVN